MTVVGVCRSKTPAEDHHRPLQVPLLPAPPARIAPGIFCAPRGRATTVRGEHVVGYGVGEPSRPGQKKLYLFKTHPSHPFKTVLGFAEICFKHA